MAKPKWGILVASKRKLRGVLTGEKASSPDQEDEILADDLIYGASAIAEYTGLTERQVYHQQVALGLIRLGRTAD
jgi:hypothetical protein